MPWILNVGALSLLALFYPPLLKAQTQSDGLRSSYSVAPECPVMMVTAPDEYILPTCCGDGICEQNETCSSCFLDCGNCPDTDGDGVADSTDNCVTTPNSFQLDCDGDGIGMACDSFEGTPNEADNTCYVGCNTLYSSDPTGNQLCYETCDISLPLATPKGSMYEFWAVGSGSGDNSSDVYKFRYCNGQVRNLTKVGESGTVLYDIAINPYTNTLYAVDGGSNLRIVNSTNGTTSLVGPTGVAVNALEFCPGPAGGLYAWDVSNLYKIDLQTGSATLVGNVGYTSSGDLACSQWGILFGTATGSGGDRLIKISRVTGAGTMMGSTGQSGMFGLENDQSEVFFGARSANNMLYILYINPQTGASTVVASIPNSYGMNGLTTVSLPY